MGARPFDIILIKGTNPISKIIQYLTKSPYSHAAMVLDSTHIVETSWNHPLKVCHIHYPRNCYDIYEITVELTEAQQNKIKGFILEHLRIRYDYVQVITHFLHLLFDFRIISLNSRFHCIEAIVKALQSAGVEVTNKFPTPACISRSPYFRLKERVK